MHNVTRFNPVNETVDEASLHPFRILHRQLTEEAAIFERTIKITHACERVRVKVLTNELVAEALEHGSQGVANAQPMTNLMMKHPKGTRTKKTSAAERKQQRHKRKQQACEKSHVISTWYFFASCER
jgi:hypothetical protein